MVYSSQIKEQGLKNYSQQISNAYNKHKIKWLGSFVIQLWVCMIIVPLYECLQFKQLVVTPGSLTIQTVTTYTVFYDRTEQNSGLSNDVAANPVPNGAVVTLSFPNQYTLNNSISVNVKINGGGTFNTPYTLTGTVITINGLFTAPTILSNLTLYVNNVKNPSPAMTTQVFTGKIGIDESIPMSITSVVQLQPNSFGSCSITFDPKYVNRVSAMQLQLLVNNQLPFDTQIQIAFLSSQWSQTLSTSSTYLPINNSMTCGSLSSNVKSTLSCSGVGANTISIKNLFTNSINQGQTISFKVNNFLSPPTAKPNADKITIYAKDNQDRQINFCSQFVTGLLPNQMNSSRISIMSSLATALTVNQIYTIRFTFDIVDLIVLTDYFQVQFPAGSNFSLVTSTLRGQLNVQNTSTATYINNVLRVYLVNTTSGAKNYSSPFTMFLQGGNYVAPPSTQTTSNFKISIIRNEGVFQVGYQTLTPVASNVSVSLTSRGNDKVNKNTSYTFTMTLFDSITPTGKIRIRFPSQVNILTTSPNCATIVGSNMASNPICVINNSTRTIELTSINSTTSINIGPQNITITIFGIQNPLSQASMGSFEFRTFYKSNDQSLVAIGSASGVLSKQQTIDTSNFVVTSSSYLVLNKSVSYYAKLTIQNQIPMGGTIMLFVPKPILLNTVTLGTSCKRGINTMTTSSTSCSLMSEDSTGYLINFSNPLTTASAPVGSYIYLELTNIVTNPPSTSPVYSFKIMTFINGFAIASLNSSIAIQMTDPTTLTSAVYTRNSNRNYQLTNYQFIIRQKPQMIEQSVVLIQFPPTGEIVPSTTNYSCGMTTPIISNNLICSFKSALIIQITLPTGTNISSDALLTLTISNVRNPTSFRPPGDFTIRTSTPNSDFKYAVGKTTNNIPNNIASDFKYIQGIFNPAYLDADVTLTLSFQPAIQAPKYIQVSIPSYFALSSGNLSCSQVANFGGICTVMSSYTIKVEGNFTSNGITTFQIKGFRSTIRAPTTVQYVLLSSFTNDNFQLDQSTQSVTFTLACTLPCQTCDSVVKTSCNSCYNNTLVTDKVIYDNITRSCFSNCPDGKYQNPTTKVCDDCDSNCKTCQASPTFCTSCKQPPTSTFQYLNIVNISSQVCVIQCQDKFYPDTSKTPVTCTGCSSPCKTCQSLTFCLTCLDTYYFWNNSCSKSCPVDSTVPDNVTGKCQLCDTNCKTCSILVNNCTSCNSTLILYQNKCITSCLLPLVYRPQILTCGPCDSQCKTCDKVANNCTSCDPTSIYKLLFNYNCLTKCDPKYYATNSTCLLCSSLNMNCDYCINSTYCQICNTGFIFFKGQCLNYTPPGYVNLSNIAEPCTPDCETCINTQTTCTSCLTLNLMGNVCQSTCPAGYIPLNKTCKPCVSPCLTCSDNVNNCTSCRTNLTIKVYFIQNRCETSCPDFYYPENSTSKCQPCQIPCLKCTDLVTCTSCATGYFLYLGKNCLSACPSQFVGINKICEACLSPCKTCVDATTKCLTCEATYFYLNSTNRCLSDCGEGLYKQFLNQTCISCTQPCKTCTNTTNTCLSCLTGILYNNQCIGTCPAKKYNDTNVCQDCPTQCSSCVNNVNCTGCTANYSLYNNFCISKCPDTHAVLVDGVCTKCSSTFCHKCYDNDVCYVCVSDYSLLKGNCLSVCPAGFKTNGTHCNEVLQSALASSSSNMFPVPFTIATCIILIACMMSKLQNHKTFLQGSIYALVGIVQTLALMFYIYLYLVQYYGQYPTGVYIALAALGVLYLLNFLSFIQSVVLCYDKNFCQWRDAHALNKCYNGFSTLISIVLSHKFKNLMFSRLFSFAVFSAQLQDVKKFKIFNIFSFISLLHSGGAIFSVITIIKLADPSKQFFHACIDVLIVTSLNIVLAFFNVFKSDDFFDQLTPQGLLLNKKIYGQTDSFNGKISMDGNDMENQEGHGYYSKIQHTLASNQAFKFKDSDDSRQDLRSDDSLTNIVQKQYEQVSVQAYDILNENQKTKIDFSTLKVNDVSKNSRFTTIFQNQDKSIQKYDDVSYVDRSMQYSDKMKKVDVSINNSNLQSQKGVQRNIMLNDRSIQQSVYAKDISIQKQQEKIQYNQISDQLQQDDTQTVKNNIFYIEQQQNQGDQQFLSNNNNLNSIQSNKKPQKPTTSLSPSTNFNKNTINRQQLPQSKQQEFDLPNQDILQYEQQLQQKIIQKQKMLQKMRKQIENKQIQTALLQQKLKRQQEEKLRKQQEQMLVRQRQRQKQDKFTMMRMTQKVDQGTQMEEQQAFLEGKLIDRNSKKNNNFVVDMNKYIKEKQLQNDQFQDSKSIKTKAKPNKNQQQQQNNKIQYYDKNRQIQVSKKAGPLNVERQQTLSQYGSIESPSRKQPGKIKIIDQTNRRIQDQTIMPSQNSYPDNMNRTQNYIYQVQDTVLNPDQSDVMDLKNISSVQTHKYKPYQKDMKKQQGTILNKTNSPNISRKNKTIEEKQSIQSNNFMPETMNNQIKQQLPSPQKAGKRIKTKMILDETNANQEFNDGDEEIAEQIFNPKNKLEENNNIQIHQEDDLVQFDSSQDIPQGLNYGYQNKNQLIQVKKNTQSDAQDYQIKRRRHKRILSKQQELKQQQIEQNNANIVNHQQIRQSFNAQRKQKSRLSNEKKKLIPQDNRQTLHVNITKLNSYSQLNKVEKEASMDKRKIEADKGQTNNRGSSLLANAAKNLVGDSDNQVLNKKPSFKQNPLVTNKKWQHTPVNKDSIDPQEQQVKRVSNIQQSRANNVLNQRNKIPHSVPLQTDKQQTSFVHTALKIGNSNNQLNVKVPSNGLKSNSIQKLSARQLLKPNNYEGQVQVHFEREKSANQREKSSSLLQNKRKQEVIDRPQVRQPSNNARINNRQVSSSKQRALVGHHIGKPPLKPTLLKQFQSQQIFADQSFNPDQDLYSQSNDSLANNKQYKQQRNNILMGKMMQRPQNDDLYEYYNRASTQKGPRNRGSKDKKGSQQKNSKSKQKDMKTNKQLQKIYMQRLDLSANSARQNQANNGYQSRYNL